jgi:hypothetical protein
VKYRIYVDTSVIGGCFDNEFSGPSIRLFEEFKKGLKIIVLSDLTIRELDNAPDYIRDIINEIDPSFIETVTLDNDSLELSNAYLAEGILGLGSMADAQHIALGTINKVDILVSWNFKHVVNYNRIRLYNAVNLKKGYGLLEIRTPLEVLDEGL